MLEFLKTHPSIFIITITGIIILILFLFFLKKKSDYYNIESTQEESCCSIEMQTLPPEVRPDEPDLIAPLPQPKLYKKLRNDINKPSKYEVPRLHNITTIPEHEDNTETNVSLVLPQIQEDSEKCEEFINLPLTPTRSHLEYLESKYGIISTPQIDFITPNKYVKNQNNGEPSTSALPPVVHRIKNKTENNSVDNRISVSEVHKHGSYVSFEGYESEFDQFDDLSRASNVMRITVDFEAPDSKFVVPVK